MLWRSMFRAAASRRSAVWLLALATVPAIAGAAPPSPQPVRQQAPPRWYGDEQPVKLAGWFFSPDEADAILQNPSRLDPADVKVLAEAFWNSGEEKYAAAALARMRQWIAGHSAPDAESPAWAPEQVTRRLLYWFPSLELLTGSRTFTAGVRDRILASVQEQAVWLEAVSTRAAPAERLELVPALAGAGLLYPRLKGAAAWVERALGLVREAVETYGPDGFARPFTPSVQVLGTAYLLGTVRLWQANGLHAPLPAGVRGRLDAIVHATRTFGAATAGLTAYPQLAEHLEPTLKRLQLDLIDLFPEGDGLLETPALAPTSFPNSGWVFARAPATPGEAPHPPLTWLFRTGADTGATSHPPLSLELYMGRQALLVNAPEHASTAWRADPPVAEQPAAAASLISSPYVTYAMAQSGGVRRHVVAMSDEYLIVHDAPIGQENAQSPAPLQIDWVTASPGLTPIPQGHDTGRLALVFASPKHVDGTVSPLESGWATLSVAVDRATPGVTTLLYPHKGVDPLPNLHLEPLPVQFAESGTEPATAVALRIENGRQQDLLLIAPGSEGERKSVQGIETDASLLWLRFDPTSANGQVGRLVMHGGTRASSDGQIIVSGVQPSAAYERRFPSVYYVSTSGDDSNPGTAAAPLRTIQRAADLMQPGDTTYVRAGTYRETVRPARSGEAEAPITFAAFPGEDVVVSGADPLTGWTVHQGRIYQAKAPDAFDQLFADGRMMIAARWPNTGLDLLHPTWGTAGEGTTPTRIVDPRLTQPEGFWDGATMLIIPGYHWVSWTRRVEYEAATHSLTFPPVSSEPAYAPQKGTYYYLTDTLAALDSPGEWHLDRDAHTVYFWPPGSDDPNKHAIEAKRRAVAFDLDQRSHITLRGFHVFAATAALRDASHCRLEEMHFQYVSHFTQTDGWGTGALDSGVILHGSHNTLVRSSVAYSAGNGVSLAGSHNAVINSLIHDVAYMAGDTGAIFATGEGHLISRNTLYNAGRSVLLHRELKGATIEYNHMYNAGLLMSDLGVTYTFQTDGAGTIIRYNWVHGNQAHIGVGIYLDNGSRHFIVHHNVVWDVADSGIRLNTPSISNQVYNNTTFEVGNSFNYWGQGAEAEDMRGTVVMNNVANEGMRLGSGVQAANNWTAGHPAFVDPARHDFRLQPSSLLVDAGQAIPGITDGYQGPAPDIGAYELGGESWVAGCDWSEACR